MSNSTGCGSVLSLSTIDLLSLSRHLLPAANNWAWPCSKITDFRLVGGIGKRYLTSITPSVNRSFQRKFSRLLRAEFQSDKSGKKHGSQKCSSSKYTSVDSTFHRVGWSQYLGHHWGMKIVVNQHFRPLENCPFIQKTATILDLSPYSTPKRSKFISSVAIVQGAKTDFTERTESLWAMGEALWCRVLLYT